MRRLRIVAALITLFLLPGYWTLGTGWLASWYEKNSFYRFKVEREINVRSPSILGYDSTQIWEVAGYTPEGCYQLKGEDGRVETHFKWNVEHHFRRV